MPYENCCGTFLKGKSFPDTAEQLMRSRYSAYSRKDADYIFKTTHPSAVTFRLKHEIEEWANSVSAWTGLKIISTFQGGPNDKIGKVEFIATYQLDGTTKTLHERSRFKRFEGIWQYLDGDILEEITSQFS